MTAAGKPAKQAARRKAKAPHCCREQLCPYCRALVAAMRTADEPDIWEERD